MITGRQERQRGIPKMTPRYRCDIRLELQARLAEENRRIPIIFITAYGTARTRAQAMEAGAVDFLGKPFNDELLLQTVRTALERGEHGYRFRGRTICVRA